MNVCRLYPKLSNKCLKMVWLCCAKNVRIGHSVSDHQHRTTLATTTRRPLRLVPHSQGCGIQCTPNLLHNKAMLLNLKTEEYYLWDLHYMVWCEGLVWSVPDAKVLHLKTHVRAPPLHLHHAICQQLGHQSLASHTNVQLHYCVIHRNTNPLVSVLFRASFVEFWLPWLRVKAAWWEKRLKSPTPNFIQQLLGLELWVPHIEWWER
jgi:hypothetical protein